MEDGPSANEISEMEDLDFYDGNPAGERWAPLGANDLDDEATCYIQHSSRYVSSCKLYTSSIQHV
jgi:hypothetical protein